MVHDPLGDPRRGARGVQDRARRRSRSSTRARRADPRGRAPASTSRTRRAASRACATAACVIDVKSVVDPDAKPPRGIRALEPVTSTLRRASATTCVNVAAPLAGHRRRRLHRLGAARAAARSRPDASSASTTSSPATSSNLDDVLAINPDERLQFRFIEGDLRDPQAARRRACKDVDIVLHQAALGSVPRSIEDPIASHRAQRRRVPQRAGRRARRRRQARRLRRVELVGLRRSPGAAEARGLGSASRCRRTRRPSASTRSTRRCSTTPTACSSIGLRYFNVFGRRQDPERPVRRGDPALDRGARSTASRA